MNRNDLSVDCDAQIDLAHSSIKCSYVFTNKLSGANSIDVSGSAFGNSYRHVTLAAKGLARVDTTDRIAVTKLSRHTRMASYRSYLLTGKEGKGSALLLADFSARLTFLLPPDSRIIKCTFPLDTSSARIASYMIKNSKVIPPIYLWYTDAPEIVYLRKERSDQGNEVRFRILLENKSKAPTGKLLLRTKFPTLGLVPAPESSDGKFVIYAVDYAGWMHDVANIPVGGVVEASFTVVKESSTNNIGDPEMIVENSNGDIIAIK